MLNFLPVLFLLMLQGSFGADISPCQANMLAALVQSQPRAAGHTDPALQSLLKSPGGRQLARRGSIPLYQWAFTAILNRSVDFGEVPQEPEVRPRTPSIPDPPSLRLSEGYARSVRSRDGPF